MLEEGGGRWRGGERGLERLKKGEGKASEQGGRICSRGGRTILDGDGGEFKYRSETGLRL